MPNVQTLFRWPFKRRVQRSHKIWILSTQSTGSSSTLDLYFHFSWDPRDIGLRRVNIVVGS